MRWFWVDRFSEYVAGSHARGLKGVSLSDEFIHGHWDIYPTMPNSLIAEGMAQTAGLLVSEMYGFKELVVLAKFTKLSFNTLVRPSESLEYHATVGRVLDAGAQCMVTATARGIEGERQQAEAEIFFARLSTSEGDSTAAAKGLPARLFDPADLARWLYVTGIFQVGVRQDGTRMKPQDYDLPVLV